MAARAGASTTARAGARKWLASLFGEAPGTEAAKTSSKSVAKERLQIILAHQRGSQVLAGVDLQALQKELLECVQRHIQVANGANINIAGTVYSSWLCFLVAAFVSDDGVCVSF
jgi:cell division topological specificity factor MinE